MYFFKPADSAWNRYVVFPVKYSDSDSQVSEIWRKFIASTLYEIVLISGFSNWFAARGAATTDPILGAVFGGALIAVGMGIAFKCRATTGGMDIIVKVIKLKFPYLKTGNDFPACRCHCHWLWRHCIRKLECDSLQRSGRGGDFKGSRSDSLRNRRCEASLYYQWSFGTDCRAVLIEIDSGVTYLEGKGAYQNTDKKVILCVIRKQNMQKMEDIVRMEDENAFMIVSSASEIYGEGNKSYFMEKL